MRGYSIELHSAFALPRRKWLTKWLFECFVCMALSLAQETPAIESLENALVQTMRSRIATLSGPELRTFLLHLRVANEELHKLAGGDPVDYELPGIGEAYAVKFHLMRADNLIVALSSAAKHGALADKVQVMDLGSGTGSTAWALAAWSVAGGSSFELKSVEESRRMKQMDDVLWRGLQRSGLLSRASVSRGDLGVAFDLLVANHLFSIPEDLKDEREQVSAFSRYALRVSNDGVILIVTPNVEKKIELTRRLTGGLAREGFEVMLEDEAAEPPKEVTSSDERRPQLLCELRREIDELGVFAGLGKVFRDPEYDDPYYGFYGRLTLLRRT